MELITKRKGNVDRFFDNFGSRWSDVPAVNIKENDKDFSIELAAPGMIKKDFHVSVENGVLEISAQKEEEKKEERKRFTRKEFSYSSFVRSFILPDSVKVDYFKATYEDGLLKLTLPKKEKPEQNQKRDFNRLRRLRSLSFLSKSIVIPCK